MNLPDKCNGPAIGTMVGAIIAAQQGAGIGWELPLRRGQLPRRPSTLRFLIDVALLAFSGSSALGWRLPFLGFAAGWPRLGLTATSSPYTSLSIRFPFLSAHLLILLYFMRNSSVPAVGHFWIGCVGNPCRHQDCSNFRRDYKILRELFVFVGFNHSCSKGN